MTREELEAETIAVERLSLAALVYEAMKCGRTLNVESGGIRRAAEQAVTDLHAGGDVTHGTIFWARMTTGALALEAQALGVPDEDWVRQPSGRMKLVEALVEQARRAAAIWAATEDL